MCQKEADQAGYHPAGSRGRKTASKTGAPTKTTGTTPAK
jgi:hypothetical protein